MFWGNPESILLFLFGTKQKYVWILIRIIKMKCIGISLIYPSELLCLYFCQSFQLKMCRKHIVKSIKYLRSFGHQGALYYFFLASDPLKTSREYAVFTLRTRWPEVCTRETSRQTQRVSAFFVLIAPNDRITSYIVGHWRPGKNFMMFQRTKNERFSKNGNIKNLVQKTKMGP